MLVRWRHGSLQGYGEVVAWKLAGAGDKLPDS